MERGLIKLIPFILSSELECGIKWSAEEIYKRLSTRMKNYALVVFENEQDAEDAVHETVLRILGNTDKFQNLSWKEVAMLAFVYLRNTCLTMRKCDKRRLYYQMDFDSLSDNFLEEYEDADMNVEAICIQNEDERQLRQLVLDLPSDIRDILDLYYRKNYKIADIARIFGLPEVNVRKKMMSGRNLLKMKWSEIDADKNRNK